MENKKIFIGADSAGYELKEIIKQYIKEKGYDVVDCGTDSCASCHYPEFASKVAKSVQKNLDTSLGILICGTGIGMSMVANKYKGIRAAVCGDTFSARMTRNHNDANVLCMGARVIGQGLAKDITDLFLENGFDGGRHKIRVDMITDIENGEH
ncbi:MAG: ribose 5-phosphate isomerase B [Eubacteriales bacterium]|nr:ribose 5-phosphate isomerase B [Eubacteriales bacterium]